MNTLEIFMVLTVLVLVSTLSFFIPKAIIKDKNINEVGNQKLIYQAIRNIFLMESLKVVNDDKSVDEVYENISKYKGAFKL